ncbi:Hypothetical predicted protein [Marmota monax]|uniref:Uncharacterized protein n=1 Tax=Marmota monax TaxID=9995 RepID=A0A5E4CQV8_MARMO|nr:hypothetical protein GHT09_017222 [Marmota monax]VTJ83539.1 Hypothetical predicted protein [Marmota monax]
MSHYSILLLPLWAAIFTVGAGVLGGESLMDKETFRGLQKGGPVCPVLRLPQGLSCVCPVLVGGPLGPSSGSVLCVCPVLSAQLWFVGCCATAVLVCATGKTRPSPRRVQQGLPSALECCDALSLWPAHLLMSWQHLWSLGLCVCTSSVLGCP